VSGRADGWIGWTTTECVTLLALIAGTVSYLHMHALVAMNGQPGWVAALTPLSVDGMIVAASTTLLAESRSGSRGGILSWSLLAVGSVASLAANVAVAQPTVTGRLIAAWPSFALICSYELLMRHVRRTATRPNARPPTRPSIALTSGLAGPPRSQIGSPISHHSRQGGMSRDLQREAWQWAQEKQAAEGSLPSGREIAHRYGRHEHWGRLVKRAGLAAEFTLAEERDPPAPRTRAESLALADGGLLGK